MLNFDEFHLNLHRNYQAETNKMSTIHLFLLLVVIMSSPN